MALAMRAAAGQAAARTAAVAARASAVPLRCTTLWHRACPPRSLTAGSSAIRRAHQRSEIRGTIGPVSATPKSGTSSSSSASPAAAAASASVDLASSLTIADVLSRYQADGRTFTCRASASLYEGVALMVASRVGCLVCMEEDGEHVAGLVTERDILSEMVRLQLGAPDATSSGSSGSNSGSSSKSSDSSNSSAPWNSVPVSQAMTVRREMVHCRPSDLISDALTLMTSMGFRHLPVLESSADGAHSLRGMVSMRNLVDILYKSQSAGGKAQFLQDILPRTGVPKNTRARGKKRGHVSSTAAGVQDGEDEAERFPSLYLNAGVCSIPHPDKKHGEDSFVAVVANVPERRDDASVPALSTSSTSLSQPFSVLAVFDGVGAPSFERGGNDPANFSNALAEGLKAYIDLHPTLLPGSPKPDALSGLPPTMPAPLSPACMLSACWEFVTSRRVVGSSTACIVALSHHSNELRAANIGDSGFLVLRRRDAQRDRVGSVGASRSQGDGQAASAYQVIYRSPQQLHYFNCPLQIGIAPSGETDKFESPADADSLAVPLRAGDVIILATDGLFDNVPEESIVEELGRAMEACEEEEKKAAAATTSDSASAATVSAPAPFALTSSSASSPGVVQGALSPLRSVASALANLALRLSLDKMTDSPFAVLAKDNNIMWKNGGRKDDITVIVARVDEINAKAGTNAAVSS